MTAFGTDLIGLALEEDIGPGDVTTEIFAGTPSMARARIVARQDCVFSGGEVAREVWKRVSPAIRILSVQPEGTLLVSGESAMEVEGPAASLLSAERVALNFLQRLSGVATLTRQYVEAIRGTPAKILDTRKTTPGLRALEKAAVRAGGGTNHRMGLHDMVMVKDNHLAAVGGIPGLQPAIDEAKRRGLRVEIEVDTIVQLNEVLALRGVDVVLLDNMSPDLLRQAVELRKPGVAFEASGGITLENIAAVAATGVDFISVGALTHSAVCVDLALDFVPYSR
ncbi:MAG: carboxylating nicotinate-nucleotide diphosphorylase [Terrimicrobiaceae bacterium]